jgi:hypothetical protein
MKIELLILGICIFIIGLLESVFSKEMKRFFWFIFSDIPHVEKVKADGWRNGGSYFNIWRHFCSFEFCD